MRNQPVASLSAAACGALLFLASAAVAEEEFSLDVSVTSPRTTLLVCEPLILDVHIRNTGGSDVLLPYMGIASERFLHVDVTDPDGNMSRMIPFIECSFASGGKGGLLLRASETYIHREPVFWQPDTGPVFDKPGKYTVTLVYQPRQGKGKKAFKPEPVLVEVREAGGRDQAALEWFKGNRQADILLHGLCDPVPGVVDPGREPIERLAKEYPNTVYGQYARYVVAGGRLESEEHWLAPAKCETAIPMFEALARDKSFPLADQCMAYLVQCCKRQHKDAEVARWRRNVAAEYPNSFGVQEANKKSVPARIKETQEHLRQKGETLE